MDPKSTDNTYLQTQTVLFKHVLLQAAQLGIFSFKEKQ